jgi:hypothetical protein
MKAMKTYILQADANRFQNLVPVAESDWETFKRFDGKPKALSWESPAIQALSDDAENRDLPPSDFPSFASHLPVFSERARKSLQPLVNSCGEFLKLKITGPELFVFNVTMLLDALDMERSTYQTFADGKRILRIRKHVFKDLAIGRVPIFKLVQLPLMHVYVTDPFVELVSETGLTGFVFQPIDEY